VFMTPVSSYLALSILFSVTIFISGISEIIYSISNRKEMDNWGWVLTGGIIDLLFGLWLMASPLLSIAILPFVVGFMLMVRSMMAIGFAIDLKTFLIAAGLAISFEYFRSAFFVCIALESRRLQD